MIHIQTPALRIIKTLPSSLGTVDWHIVLYDLTALHEPEPEKWIEDNEHEIAEDIYESAHYLGVYIIHSTTTRGEDIRPLDEQADGATFNRINLDSVLSFHCLAVQTVGNNLQVRTGFHEAFPDVDFSTLPFQWDQMDRLSNGFQALQVNKETFFALYFQAIENWNALHIFKPKKS